MDKKIITREILAMESTALQMLGNTDITGYLDIYSEDVTYFDPFQERVIYGKGNMASYFRQLTKRFPVRMYEIIDPITTITEDMVMLVFGLEMHTDDVRLKWNCTEVYCKEEDSRWRIIHTHWSFCRPMDIPDIANFSAMPSFG